MRAAAKLRIARPTDHLAKIALMYEQGLGLARLSQFEDHDGFDGVMLGHPGQSWHLEFTHHRGHCVGRAQSRDNLLVFYVATPIEHQACRERMSQAGFVEVASCNPYWDKDGVTFEDPDGYRVVLQQESWNL
jgi:hypothetical protein